MQMQMDLSQNFLTCSENYFVNQFTDPSMTQ